MNCAHCLRLLDARIDGELDAATAADFDAHLGSCPDCHGRRQERAALSSLVELARDPAGAPPGLVQRIRESLVADRRGARPYPTRSWQNWWRGIALPAGVAILATIATVVMLKFAYSTEDVLLPVVERHVAAMASGAPQGVTLQVAASGRHDVKPWFQGRVPFSPPVPDLADEGFDLLGGRVERVANRETGVVVYRIRHHPIELYTWLDTAPAAGIERESLRGFSIVRWRSDGLAFTAISDVNSQDLARFATLVEARRR